LRTLASRGEDENFASPEGGKLRGSQGGLFKVKRRDFVKTMTAAGASLLLRPDVLMAQAEQPQPDPSIKRVMVMFKCHFDAGFVDTQYNVVHKRYFEKFFPEAIEIARAANAGGKRYYV